MSVQLEVVRYKCDWTNELDEQCDCTGSFESGAHEKRARDAGWGAYTNAYVRRSKWTEGAEMWFCPVHATVFRNNHGWGGLEEYKPPTKWWQSFTGRNPR